MMLTPYAKVERFRKRLEKELKQTELLLDVKVVREGEGYAVKAGNWLFTVDSPQHADYHYTLYCLNGEARHLTLEQDVWTWEGFPEGERDFFRKAIVAMGVLANA